MQDELVTIARYYGYESQSRQLIEEMAELIQAINKRWREEDEIKQAVATYHVVEEIADVEVCLEQIKWLLDCNDAVEYFKEEKIKRQLERMKNNE